MSLKFGRLPATRPAALSDLSVYATGKLPTPPKTVEPPKGVYPMDGNDQYGDCTMAGVAHLIEAFDAEVAEKDPIPAEQEVVNEYFKLTGGEDTGLNEAEVLKVWHTKGLFGETIAGYAPVNPKDLLELHQSIAFYGGCYLGIECGPPQQEQFQRGEQWVWEDSAEEDEGHCVVALGYGPNGGLHVKTWGGEAILTAGFLAHNLQEAWCILPHQLIEAKKDNLGLDLAALEADLAKV